MHVYPHAGPRCFWAGAGSTAGLTRLVCHELSHCWLHRPLATDPSIPAISPAASAAIAASAAEESWLADVLRSQAASEREANALADAWLSFPEVTQ